MSTFREKWLAAVEKKNSVLCAGLDPAEFEMGRGQEGLPAMTDKKEWSFQYLRSIGPYAAALKINVNYWKDRDDMRTVEELADIAVVEFDMAVIDDSKLADIGSTNDAGLYHAKQKGFDAVTLAPFAGNLKEAAEQARKRDIGLISMCLMSNPEYESIKNERVPVQIADYPNPYDAVEIDGVPHVKKYIQLAHDAARYGIDGTVIGAPSKKNHLKDKEIFTARQYSRDNTLVLLPGVGAQGGEAEKIWRYFDKDNVIVNVGRGLMFPNGSKSTPADQAEAAKFYQNMLNKSRAK
ncbi:MAG: orotidine 5'-phosphate decarboxylase / HUMPS family protein [Nanoarchaeota archaeon]